MSTASAKTQAQKKVQRQKQFIAVGSVVLLVILGFEMTKVLSHGSHPATPATPPATPSSVPGAAGSPPSTSGSPLPDTDRVVVQRAPNQLISFGLFSSKDPFVQQVTTTASPSVPPAAAVPAPTTGKTGGAVTTTAAPITPSQPAGAVLTPVTSTTPAPSAPGQATSPTTSSTPIAPTSALISTNGVCESVAVKGTFPYGADIFRLVSIARDGKSVQIGVVGGSYDSGQASATLKMSEKLTLVNTGDGTRYVIQLKSKCDVVAQPTGATGAPSATTTQPVTPVPPAPTTTTTTTTPATTTTSPTATTPIVPDSLDPTTTVPTG